MMSKIRVVILAGEGESTLLIYNGIKDDFLIEKVVIEKPKIKLKLLKNRVKNLGLTRVVGQLFFMIYNLLWMKPLSKKRIKEIKDYKKISDKKINETNILEVSTINSKRLINILQHINPDVVVVNGTQIIKKQVIDSVGAKFINIHVGITPKYRGVHGGYWALVNNDRENCGVTVHLIDEGIDTGGVLYQDVINPIESDNFNTYPYLQMERAIPLMKKAIIDVASHSYKLQNSTLLSKLWSHPTILEYLKNKSIHGIK
jgi:methionyl-tRNA formyltransferase